MRMPVSVLAILSLAACGDPLRGIEDLSDVTLAPEEPLVSIATTDAEGAQTPSVLEALLVQPATDDAEPDVVSEVASATEELTDPEKPARPSVLGWLRRVAPKAEPEEEPVEIASLSDDIPLAAPEDEPRARPAAVKRSPRLSRKSVAIEATFGASVPFGTVARVCEAKRHPLGQKAIIFCHCRVPCQPG